MGEATDYLKRMDVAALPDGSVLVTDVRVRDTTADVRSARVHLPTMHIEQLEEGADGNALPVNMIYHKVAVSLPTDHASYPDPILESFQLGTNEIEETNEIAADASPADGMNGSGQSPLVESKGPVQALKDEFETNGYDVAELDRVGDELHFDVYHDNFEKVKALGGRDSVAGYNGEVNTVDVDDVPTLVDEVRNA